MLQYTYWEVWWCSGQCFCLYWTVYTVQSTVNRPIRVRLSESNLPKWGDVTGGRLLNYCTNMKKYIFYLEENRMAIMGRLKTEFHRSARATRWSQNKGEKRAKQNSPHADGPIKMLLFQYLGRCVRTVSREKGLISFSNSWSLNDQLVP